MDVVLILIGAALVIFLGLAGLELFIVCQERRVSFLGSLASLGRGVRNAAAEQGLGRRSIEGDVR